MGCRKGELSPGAIDREWPHQISLLADDCTGANYYTVNLFADALSICTRGHSYFHEGKWRRGCGSRWAQLREPKKKID
jgi:hypothetical protein